MTACLTLLLRNVQLSHSASESESESEQLEPPYDLLEYVWRINAVGINTICLTNPEGLHIYQP